MQISRSLPAVVFALALGLDAQVISAPSNIITTFAGNGTFGYTGDGGAATSAAFNVPGAIAFDAAGNVYIADVYGNNVVRKVDKNGIITTVAGNGASFTKSPIGNGGPATNAQINPWGLAVDSAGNLYISDEYNAQIRKVDAKGIITAFAGTGTQGYSGDGGPATSAQLNYPEGIVFDAAGNLYIADQWNRRIRKVDTQGIITTVAGDGTAPPAGFRNAGDGGLATSAHMVHVRNVAVDAAGNLYIAETDVTQYAPQPTSRIRKVDTHGTITTFAGTGAVGYSGDGGPATSAKLGQYVGLGVDAAGNLYLADQDSNRLRRIDKSGTINTVAGNGTFGSSGDGGPPGAAALAGPTNVAVDVSGALYLSEQSSARVRKIILAPASAQQFISATAGTPQSAGVATPFLTTLRATVKDSGNVPLSGVVVTFSAPSPGPGAKFNNSLTATATTNASGIASAPALTANNTAGTYNVVASLSSGGQATFALTNTGTKLAASPTQITFTCQSGGSLPAAQTVNLTGTSNGTYSAVASDASLSVSPVGGPVPATLKVSLVDPAACNTAAPVLSRSIQISSPGAPNTPLSVTVTLTVTPGPKISVSAAKLAFAFLQGGATPLAQTVSISMPGTGTFTASSNSNWLSMTPSSKALPAVLSVSVNPAGLSPGVYNGSVNITVPGAGNNPLVLPVTLTVSGPPMISLSPNQANFTYQTGGSVPPPQPVVLTSSAKIAITAAGNASWLSVNPGSGSANLTLTVSVSPAALGPGTYNGVITISSQGASNSPQTLPVRLTVTTACSYFIQSDPVQIFGVPGGDGMFQIITAQGCPWTAHTTANWITINSLAAGSGNGAVSFQVTANTTGVARSATVAVAGQVVTINQAGGAPAIVGGGVVNVASYASGASDSGLAQGSFFSIFGANLGPDLFVKASSYPLPATLGGVGVQVVQGTDTYDAYLVYVSTGQVNALLPSNVPVGSAQVILNYGGQSSQPVDIVVAKTSFGVFFQSVNGQSVAIAQNVASSTDYPLNLPAVPAKPGEIVVLWGTGLGAIDGGDNVAPGPNAGDMAGVPVTITVGGVTAERIYAGRQSAAAGVDNIYFKVPAEVPFGCQIPVVVTAGGVAANTTMIAITADGSACKPN